MARILIQTQVHDVHALAVAHALRLRGHEPVLWYGADFPTRQTASLELSGGSGLCWEVAGPALHLADEHFDTVWCRRPSSSVVLPSDMHPGDRAFAESECKVFRQALSLLVGPRAFWVNPSGSRERAASKPVQLLEAVRAGLQIPPTLCSNDPEKIRRFLADSDGEVIYKSFRPHQWELDDEGVALLFTTVVRGEDLPTDDTLRLAPGIFQARLPKAYELRVTFMGGHQVTARIMSQKKAASQLDWRAAFTDIDVEPGELPEGTNEACRRLMERLGIVFGCFDFIVTPAGEHIFLEVNEMGQFLFIEEINPEIRLLAPFTEFLIGGDARFRWRPGPDGMSWPDLKGDLEGCLQEELRLHVEEANQFRVSDRAEPDVPGAHDDRPPGDSPVAGNSKEVRHEEE
jgi:hypothetical protein